MNLFLASTAELYREHRRTQSAKKKLKIADELQRRHDEQNGGHYYWRFYEGRAPSGRPMWHLCLAYNFRLLL